jgi:lipopolysaccharide export system permease protein
MKKIDAYIFKKYIGTFFFAISMLILVVIIFDLSENIDSFLIDEKTTLYSARHTFATIFINSEGAKTSELAQMMGRSVSGIDRYIKDLMTIEDVLKARDKME